METSKITTQKITPCLWFDREAEAAANFYTSIFKNSKILEISRYGKENPDRAGEVLTIAFQLEGTTFTGLNAGPQFKFSEAISFQVSCENQEEVDYFWDSLIEGGKPSQCGWLQDKFGLSWQIVPVQMGRLLSGKEPEKSQRAMEAMMKMVKLDIEELEKAYAG